MVYRIYGNTFKNIRIQKRYSLSYFEKIGINKSNLSKFERGITMMGIERIDAMLQEMNVSLSEYDLMCNHFIEGFQEDFLERVDEADLTQNHELLIDLYQEAHDYGFKWLAYAAKARESKLTEYEIEELIAFLSQIELWGFFELSLIYYTVDSLEVKDIRRFLTEFDNKCRNHYTISKYRKRIFQIIYRAVCVLISRKEQKLAKFIIDANDIKNFGHDLFIKNLRNLVVGYYRYEFENQDQGLNEITNSLIIFENLDCEAMSEYYKNKLFTIFLPFNFIIEIVKGKEIKKW